MLACGLGLKGVAGGTVCWLMRVMALCITPLPNASSSSYMTTNTHPFKHLVLGRRINRRRQSASVNNVDDNTPTIAVPLLAALAKRPGLKERMTVGD